MLRLGVIIALFATGLSAGIDIALSLVAPDGREFLLQGDWK